MTGRARVLILIAVVALCGLQASGASATETTRIKSSTMTSSFGLRASGRYWVEVTATAKNWRTAPTVTVEAVEERYKVEQVTVAYTTHGRWLDNDGGFVVNLPGLGRIAVRLDETSAQRVGRPGGCKGPENVVRKGTFHGTIAFRGRRGFTTVHAGSAPGFLRETFRLTCREKVYEPVVEAVPPGTYTPTVSAVGTSAGGTASFSVSGPPETEPPTSSGGIPTVMFQARYQTSWHGYDVVADTFVDTGSYLYHVPGWPTSHTDAIAEPPRPFTGKGVFHLESPTASTWSGELGIDFPGIGHVPLSGPTFTARLCESLTCFGTPPPPAPVPAARALTDAAAGTRHIDDFFSPGRKIWCQISHLDGEASCGTYPKPPTHAATLTKNGKVQICAVEKLEYPAGPGHPPAGCFQNWPTERLPILRVGEATNVGGVRCSSGTDGITCARVSGPAKGKGFRIDTEEAVKLPLALRLTALRPACTRQALTNGLRAGGLRGHIDGETFGCAGHFAYAGVIVDRNEVTVLFRAGAGAWRPVSRARFCTNGSVPRQIYRPACESN